MGVGQTPAFVSSRRRSVKNWSKENAQPCPHPPFSSFFRLFVAVNFAINQGFIEIVLVV